MPNIKRSTQTGKFVKHAQYVKKVCENCKLEFETKLDCTLISPT